MPPSVDGRQVVIDAGAAIKLQRLERLGSELYTTSGVLSEVRDEQARALLNTLPIELRIKEALPQDLAFVKHFAKATGDLGFLSQNDMALIALTVQLHREAGGTVREQPAELATEQGSIATFDWAPSRVEKASTDTPSSSSTAARTFAPAPRPAGAAAATAAPAEDEAPPADADADGGGWTRVSGARGREEVRGTGREAADAAGAEVAAPRPAAQEAPGGRPELTSAAGDAEVPPEDAAGGPLDEDADSDGEDGSSAGEWVTPDNMHRFGVGVEASTDLRVTCATADYSVQNVLLQMGITPLTFDGYAVRSVKLWGLVCRACFFFTRETQKVFCPKCGHDTLVRVPIVVGQDGKPTALNSGRKLRTKGTVYSVPKPQGGRGWKPIFAADEVMIGGRDRELRRLENLAGKERQARDPFNEDNAARAWWQRGTTSTGKSLSGDAPRFEAGYGRRVNPNANNFRGFGRKKR